MHLYLPGLHALTLPLCDQVHLIFVESRALTCMESCALTLQGITLKYNVSDLVCSYNSWGHIHYPTLGKILSPMWDHVLLPHVVARALNSRVITCNYPRGTEALTHHRITYS
jgi:hypothetical protein